MAFSSVRFLSICIFSESLAFAILTTRRSRISWSHSSPYSQVSKSLKSAVIKSFAVLLGACFLPLNCALSKITFFLTIKNWSKCSIMTSDFFASASLRLKLANMSSAGFPRQYSKVYTCRASGLLAGSDADRKHKNRCFNVGHFSTLKSNSLDKEFLL